MPFVPSHGCPLSPAVHALCPQPWMPCVPGSASPMSPAVHALCPQPWIPFVPSHGYPLSPAVHALCPQPWIPFVPSHGYPLPLAMDALCPWPCMPCVPGSACPVSLAMDALCPWSHVPRCQGWGWGGRCSRSRSSHTELQAGLRRSGLELPAASGAGYSLPANTNPAAGGWPGARSCGELNGALLETEKDMVFHHFGAQTVSAAPTRELFVWFKDLFILLWFFFPNHPLQVLGEGSVSFFLFPAHLPIRRTNILEQASGGEGALINPWAGERTASRG